MAEPVMLLRVGSTALLSYAIGSIPTAYLLVKRLKGLDVRTIGSGNVGATNVARAAGRWAGAVVFLCDAAKGWMAVSLVAPWMLPEATMAQRLSCGLLAVVGHDAPVWLRFQGGKGVATTIGVLTGTTPQLAAVYVGTWLAVVLGCRYVSMGSMVAAATIPLTQWWLHRSPAEILCGAMLALLIIVKHHGNVIRLAQGREPPISRRPAKQKSSCS